MAITVACPAHDRDAGRKRDIAAALLRELWGSRTGILSTQVLQEFYVNVTRKIKAPLPRDVAKDILSSYAAWQVEVIEPEHILRASEIEARYQLSFWDAMIVSAAWSGGASRIASEDLQHAQEIESIRIENPFAT